MKKDFVKLPLLRINGINNSRTFRNFRCTGGQPTISAVVLHPYFV